MHPILFHLHTPFGTLPVYAFGTMLGLAILLGWYLMRAMARRFEVDEDAAGNTYAFSVVAALVFGRLAFVVVDPALRHAPSALFAPSRGGLLGAVAVVGGALALVGLARRHGVSPLRMADLATPALALALLLVRIGCYLFGCDYGRRLGHGAPSFLARLGTFPRWDDVEAGQGPPAYLRQLADARAPLSLDATHAFPVHPTQLYEALVGAILLGLSFVAVRRARRPGDVFVPFAIAYGIARLVIEPFRDDPERGVIGAVTAPGVVATVLVLAGAVFLLRRHLDDRRAPLDRLPGPAT